MSPIYNTRMNILWQYFGPIRNLNGSYGHLNGQYWHLNRWIGCLVYMMFTAHMEVKHYYFSSHSTYLPSGTPLLYLDTHCCKNIIIIFRFGSENSIKSKMKRNSFFGKSTLILHSLWNVIFYNRKRLLVEYLFLKG